MPPAADPPPPAPRPGFAAWWLGTVLVVAGVLFPAFSLVALKWWDTADLRWVHELHWRKHKLLERLPPGPRLLVVGGSSALFGVDAELLEARLGVPTMNLGLHGGLGLRFFLVEARRVARRSDTVLLHLEPAQYTGVGEARAEMERNYGLTYDPGYLLHLPFATAATYVAANRAGDYADGLARWDQRLRGDLPKGDPERWAGYPFVLLSPRGDLRADELPAKPFETPALKRASVTKGAGRLVSEFLEWAEAHGVRVVATIPSMAAPADDAVAKKLHEFADDLGKWARKHELPLVGTLREALLPTSWMLDSQFHPAPLGRRVRTELLGAQLAEHFARQAAPLPWLVVTAEPGLAASTLPHGNAVRVLGSSAGAHPASVTPPQVGEVVGAGAGVLCSGKQAVDQLSAAGLRCLPERGSSSPVPALAASHVGLFATADQNKTEVKIESAAELAGNPSELVRGRYSRESAWELRLHATGLPGQDRGSSSIVVERNLVAQHDGPGWVRATLDPALGIVVHRVTSATAPQELFRVTGPAGDAVQ